MGKSRARVRHLYPPGENADRLNSPWCPCRPSKRLQTKPITTAVYIHNPLPERERPPR